MQLPRGPGNLPHNRQHQVVLLASKAASRPPAVSRNSNYGGADAIKS